MSIGEMMSCVGSIGTEIDTTGSLNAVAIDGSAATVMHRSAQLVNDLAGQQGHRGACPSWLMEE